MLNSNAGAKLLGDIGQLIWVAWSNFLFKKLERFNTEVDESDKVKNIDDIAYLVRKLYSKFKYTKDGADQFYDAIVPPPETYKRYREGLLKDDCDGFHSLVYHCLKASGFQCYLLITHSVKSGHCTLVFKYQDLWYVCDYTGIYGSTTDLYTTIEEFNLYFERTYSPEKPVNYNALIEYNYETGKFKFLNFDKTITKTRETNKKEKEAK